MHSIIAQVGQDDLALFGLAVFFVLSGLLAYFYLSYWNLAGKKGISPYTGLPLRPAHELTYSTKERVRMFLREQGSSENRPFDFNKAALCRDTGRLFPDCSTFFGGFQLDWSFINKKARGNFLSWGSLSENKKNEIIKAHDPLTGFQTEFSSRNPSPRMVEESFALQKPGPLYADPDSLCLVGWKLVPGTEIEVLIVQRPKKIHVVKYTNA